MTHYNLQKQKIMSGLSLPVNTPAISPSQGLHCSVFFLSSFFSFGPEFIPVNHLSLMSMSNAGTDKSVNH